MPAFRNPTPEVEARAGLCCPSTQHRKTEGHRWVSDGQLEQEPKKRNHLNQANLTATTCGMAFQSPFEGKVNQRIRGVSEPSVMEIDDCC
jgi:hypothetical protein